MNPGTDIGRDHSASQDPSRNLNPYLRTRVLTAGPEELRLLLLEGAVKFASQGREGLARKDYEASYNGISQCRAIVLELLTTIRTDIDPDLMDKVKGIYTFIYQELTNANLEKSVDRMDKIVQLLEYEAETWRMLMHKLATERGPATTANNNTPTGTTTGNTPGTSTGNAAERKPFSVSA